MNIGNAVKKVRVQKGFNQKQFCEKIGVTQSYLSLIENNKKKPSTEVLEKIAKSVNTTLPVLFWFSVEEVDVDSGKVEVFNQLKPMIDKMLEGIFN